MGWWVANDICFDIHLASNGTTSDIQNTLSSSATGIDMIGASVIDKVE